MIRFFLCENIKIPVSKDIFLLPGSLAPAAKGKPAAVAEGGGAGTTDADADLQARLDDLRRE